MVLPSITVSENHPHRTIPRRTLAAGAVWATPIIAVAASAPVTAASVTPVCVETYPFVVQSLPLMANMDFAVYTNTGSTSVTFTFIQAAPYHPTATAIGTADGSGWSTWYNPGYTGSGTMPNSVTYSSTPLSCPATGACTWTVTVTVPAGASFYVGTQSVYTGCVGTGSLVTITVDDCNYTYLENCPR